MIIILFNNRIALALVKQAPTYVKAEHLRLHSWEFRCYPSPFLLTLPYNAQIMPKILSVKPKSRIKFVNLLTKTLTEIGMEYSIKIAHEDTDMNTLPGRVQPFL